MSRKYTANEMREMALVEESYGWDVVAKMLRQAADMMERESTREKSSQIGNAAKMREALNEIRARLVYIYGLTDGTFDPPALKEIYEIAGSALAAPKKKAR